MRAQITSVGLTKVVERGVIPEEEWAQIKRTVARELDAEIRRAAPSADEDPHVHYNYKKDWRTANLPLGKVFGSDYDYWQLVVDDVFRLWDRWAGNIYHDFIAESIAKEKAPWSVERYKGAGLEVWENGRPVGQKHNFHGPRVDVGPKADFSVFLERWSHSKTTNAGVVPLFWTIGVLNAIARQLAVEYAGVHTVFLMPIKPTDRSEAVLTPNRSRPVELFPIIRIAPRQWAQKRGRR